MPKKSLRLEKKATLRRALPELLEHIEMLGTHEELEELRQQMRSERIPLSRDVKIAIETQAQRINEAEQEQRDAEEAEETEKSKIIKAALARLRHGKLPDKYKNPSSLFGLRVDPRLREEKARVARHYLEATPDAFARAAAIAAAASAAPAPQGVHAFEGRVEEEGEDHGMDELVRNFERAGLGSRQGGTRKRRNLPKKKGSRRSRR